MNFSMHLRSVFEESKTFVAKTQGVQLGSNLNQVGVKFGTSMGCFIEKPKTLDALRRPIWFQLGSNLAQVRTVLFEFMFKTAFVLFFNGQV